MCQGDSIAAVFTTSQTLAVPAGGTYSIVIKLKNDKTNELWQIKNGNVTAYMRIFNPLPISLIDFTSGLNKLNQVQLDWSAMSKQNNHYFSVERSNNGNTFKEIHREE